MEIVRKTIESRYKVFRLLNDNNSPRLDFMLCKLENCTPEGFNDEQGAADWIITQGDFRTLGYEYIIMLCSRVVAHYE